MFRSLRGYRRSWLRGDVVAGLTVWAVLVPEALAYASIAGVSPVVGLYAAPGRCCCTPPLAAPGTWSPGRCQLHLRAGAQGVHHRAGPDHRGRAAAQAVRHRGRRWDVFEKLWDLLTHLGDTHLPTLALGLVSLALVLGLRRLAPAVPGSLVAVLSGIVVVWALGLDDRGVDIVIVGHIGSGLPSLGLPDVAAAVAALTVLTLLFLTGLFETCPRRPWPRW